MSKLVTINCAHCGVEHTYENRGGLPKVYCSAKCRDAAKDDRRKADPVRHAAYNAQRRDQYWDPNSGRRDYKIEQYYTVLKPKADQLVEHLKLLLDSATPEQEVFIAQTIANNAKSGMPEASVWHYAAWVLDWRLAHHLEAAE